MATTADIGELVVTRVRDSLIYTAPLYVRDATGQVIESEDGRSRQSASDLNADTKAADDLADQALDLKAKTDAAIALNAAHAPVRDAVKSILAGGA